MARLNWNVLPSFEPFKLHFYLHGATFTVITDCEALKTLLTTKLVNRHMLDWQVSLLDYQGRMDVAHHSGKSHANADGPSHFPLPNDSNNLAAECNDLNTLS
jgi:hypothetical protein